MLNNNRNIKITKYSFCIILISAFSYKTVTAQTIRKHQIGFHLGFAHYETKDNLISPFIYSGNRIPLQLYYNYDGLKNRHRVNVSYNKGKIENSINNWADEWAAGLRYDYHRYALSFLNNKGKLFIGGVFNNSFSYRNYYFRSYSPYLKYYTDVSFWDLISSINLSFLGEYQLKERDRIALQIIVPVFANVIRPGYSILPPDNILRLKDSRKPSFSDIVNAENMATINTYFQIDFLLSYEVNLSDRFNLKWNYSFKYFSYTIPLKANAFVNELGVDIILLL